MEAMQLSNDVALIDYNRCIGCGARTFGCPQESLTLVKKPENALYTPPANIVEAYMDIAVEREKCKASLP